MSDFERKTDYLIETKGLLKDRINSLGGSITSGTTFRDYLVWLDSLYEALEEKTITGLPDSLEGKCTQDTTPSKNILPSNWEQGMISTTDGTTITPNNYWVYTPDFLDIHNLDNITVSFKETCRTVVFFYNENKVKVAQNQGFTVDNVRTYQPSTNNYYYMRIGYNLNGTAEATNPTTIYNHEPMINVGTSALPYEPYSPTTPSPVYPRPIETTTGEQVVSVCGKNLFDIGTSLNDWFQTGNVGLTINNTTINRTTATITDNTLTIDTYNNSGYTWISKWLYLQPNTDYIISGTNDNDLKIVGFSSSALNTVGTGITTKTSSNTTKTFNSGNYNYYCLSFYPGTSGKKIQNIMIAKGTDTTYEEYKGNTYEINLGKNLFSDTLRQGVTTYNTGAYSNSNTRITSTDWITLKAGTYTISADTTITGNRYLQISCVTFDTSGNFYSISGVSGQWQRLPFTFTTPIDLNWKCNISFNDSYSLTPSDVYDIQLEKGTQSSYSPYKTPIELCKIGNYQDFIKKGTGKNILDMSSLSTLSANRYITSGINHIEIVPNTTYTFSVKSSTGTDGLITIYDGNGNETQTITQSANSKASATFTTGANDSYLIINRWYIDSTAITVESTEPMLEEGTQRTLFEPYGYEGQWYLHKEVGKVVLNGSENWSSSAYGTNSWDLNNVIDTTFNTNELQVMSSVFKGVAHKDRATSGNNIIYSIANKNIEIRNTTLTTKAQVQSATSGTPIYYILNTPTNTLIEDEELINQLNEIEIFTVISEDFYN